MNKKYGVTREKLKELFQFQAKYRRTRMLIPSAIFKAGDEIALLISKARLYMNHRYLQLIRNYIFTTIPFSEIDSFHYIEEDLLVKIIFQDEYDLDTCEITAIDSNQLFQIVNLLQQARDAENVPPNPLETSGGSSSSSSPSENEIVFSVPEE